MKFSFNWITELVPVQASARELASLITIKTAESEGVEAFAPHMAAICAARITAVEAIAGSKNVKAVVDTGRYGIKTVVCGAPNCRPGVVTAYVPAGARIGVREIRVAEISGVESDGLLASGAELGLNRDTAGILELSSEPGSPVAQSDWVIEIDNKSLTHRPDLWGHHGMAREVAAILRKPLKDPVDLALLPQGVPAIRIEIEDRDLCPRFSALVFENVTVQPSPLWLQARLEAVGLNPINNIVDVTNFVMAELAQPTHAYDADKLQGGIRVRRARDGETIEALNGSTYELGSSNLIIADDKQALGIAGVIGGMQSAISASTTRIVFESANFEPTSVRKTSSVLKLRTDASMRFEKAQDANNTVRALARAIELLRHVSPGIRLVGGLADAGSSPSAPEPIMLPLEWLNRKLGQTVSQVEAVEILEALHFGVSEAEAGVLRVAVPSWRATKDIAIKDDLVEEIGRMIGYGSITPSSPLLPATIPPADPARDYRHHVRRSVAAQGFHEVSNYSFLSDDIAEQFALDPNDFVRVLNPIASDQALLRTSLVPGILKNIIENSKYADEFRFFEIGHEIHKRQGLPLEITHLAIAIYRKSGAAEGLYELKRVAEGIAPGIEFRPAAGRIHEHPHRTAEAVLEGEVVGRLFEFHPNFVKGRAAVLDLDLDALLRLVSAEKRYTPIRRFPSSAFDLSVLTTLRAHAGVVLKDLRRFSGDTLEGIEFLREYSGAPLPDNTKSLSYRVTLGARDRTLSSDEVTATRNQIIEGMRGLGYELRV